MRVLNPSIHALAPTRLPRVPTAMTVRVSPPSVSLGEYTGDAGAAAGTVAAFGVLGIIESLGSLAGMASGAYHGYMRNHESIGWGIGWGLLGGLFWPITIPVSLAQGFGEPKV